MVWFLFFLDPLDCLPDFLYPGVKLWFVLRLSWFHRYAQLTDLILDLNSRKIRLGKNQHESVFCLLNITCCIRIDLLHPASNPFCFFILSPVCFRAICLWARSIPHNWRGTSLKSSLSDNYNYSFMPWLPLSIHYRKIKDFNRDSGANASLIFRKCIDILWNCMNIQRWF